MGSSILPVYPTCRWRMLSLSVQALETWGFGLGMFWVNEVQPQITPWHSLGFPASLLAKGADMPQNISKAQDIKSAPIVFLADLYFAEEDMKLPRTARSAPSHPEPCCAEVYCLPSVHLPRLRRGSRGVLATVWRLGLSICLRRITILRGAFNLIFSRCPG